MPPWSVHGRIYSAFRQPIPTAEAQLRDGADHHSKSELLNIHKPETAMQIWVDADACPNVIKEILFRAADRTQTSVILVANQPVRTPASKFVTSIQVPGGFDVADNEIVKRLQQDDLVITADIPLAAEVVEKGGHAINPRGERYTKDNIKQRLSMRNFMDELRSSGVDTGGPPSLNQSDRQAFANQLDRFLTQSKQG
jgi:uncharacterized protein YaiI (UPF0178 family)